MVRYSKKGKLEVGAWEATILELTLLDPKMLENPKASGILIISCVWGNQDIPRNFYMPGFLSGSFYL